MNKRRVLVVEDVEEMRVLIVELLQRISGISVAGAANCTEARLELSRRKPDLCFLDEVLPGESALDFLDALREAAVPTILITGMDRPQHPIPASALTRIAKPGWKTLAADEARFAEILKGIWG